MMDPKMAIVLAADWAIIEATVMITIKAARNIVRVVWSKTTVRKRMVMAMMMWVRWVTVGSMMQRRKSSMAAAVSETISKAALTARGSPVAETISPTVPVAVATAVWNSMTANVAVALPVAVSSVAAGMRKVSRVLGTLDMAVLATATSVVGGSWTVVGSGRSMMRGCWSVMGSGWSMVWGRWSMMWYRWSVMRSSWSMVRGVMG